MRIISIINLKGGCAKTTTAVSMAELLATRHGKRVLLLDNDKQGNASRLYKRYSQGSRQGAQNMIRSRSVSGNIMDTGIEGLSLIPCNYYMEQAALEILKDPSTRQHDRYREALGQTAEDYDYCIIDNPPDIGINVVNAGCLVTDYERSATSEAAEEWIRARPQFKLFKQHIRHSRQAKDATFYHQSVITHSVRSGAAQDYKKFVEEYLGRAGDGI